MRPCAVMLMSGSIFAIFAFTLIAKTAASLAHTDSPTERSGSIHPQTCDQFAPPMFFREGGEAAQMGMLPSNLRPLLMLAGLLSAAEIRLGISSSQLDLWLDFQAS